MSHSSQPFVDNLFSIGKDHPRGIITAWRCSRCAECVVIDSGTKIALHKAVMRPAT